MLISVMDPASGSFQMPSSSPDLTPGSLAAINQTQASASSELGNLHINSAETVYVSSAHWSAILENLSELRDYIRRRDKDETPADSSCGPESTCSNVEQSSEGPELFSGRITAIPKAELVAAIPDRAVVNRLVYRYFNSCP